MQPPCAHTHCAHRPHAQPWRGSTKSLRGLELRSHPMNTHYPCPSPTYLEKLNLGKRMKFFMKMVKSSASFRNGSLKTVQDQLSRRPCHGPSIPPQACGRAETCSLGPPETLPKTFNLLSWDGPQASLGYPDISLRTRIPEETRLHPSWTHSMGPSNSLRDGGWSHSHWHGLCLHWAPGEDLTGAPG